MSLVTPEFSESWRYAGWTSTQESSAGGILDTNGNLILCGKSNGLAFAVDGTTYSSTISADFSAVKLDGTSGEELWTWVDSSVGGGDWMVSAGADSDNNVILGGSTSGEWDSLNPDFMRDIAAVKLDGSTGEELWRYQTMSSTSSSLGGGGVGVSFVLAVAVDGDNPVLVGSTYNRLVDGVGIPGDWNFFAIKLAGDTGDEMWRMQGGAPFVREGLRGAKMDPEGDLVAAGYSEDEESGVLNFLVVKLSGLDGSLIWSISPNNTTGDMFQSVDIDDSGDVFVAGGEGSPGYEGTFAEVAVILKLDGASGEEVWAYRGEGGRSIILNGIAIDPTTGWVVGAGGVAGDWVEGESRGGRDFAAVVLDSDTGAEIARWQNGTIGTDMLQFAEFDDSGALYFGGLSSAAWTGGSGDEDFIAIKFQPLAELTEAPSSAPTWSPSFASTSHPTPRPSRAPGIEMTSTDAPRILAEAPVPPSSNRDVTFGPSMAPTTAPSVVSGAQDSSSAGLKQWAVSAIAVAGGLVLILLALYLCSLRVRAKKKMAELAAAQARAQQVPPVPSTKGHMAFAEIYRIDSQESQFSSEDNPAKAGGFELPRY